MKASEKIMIKSDLEENPEDLLTNILTEGTQFESTSKSIDINKRPIYFCEKRFKKAQATCNKYFASISMASTTGLILLVQIESILVPLLKTGKSKTVPDLFDRYVGTAKCIRKCYETDFYESTSEGWKCISFVRGMHQRIHKLMNEISGASKQLTSQNMWVNQYDMALTQFAFIGLFLLNPSKCGAYYITEEELLDVTYYWRVLSYYFGIEERFNIFSYDNDWKKQQKLMELMLRHINDELLHENRNKTGLEMAKGIILAFEDFTWYVSFNILDHWWSPYISVSGLKELKPYTFSDRCKLVTFLFYFQVLFRIEILLGFFTSMYKNKFDKFCSDGHKIKPKLAEKYKNLIYE